MRLGVRKGGLEPPRACAHQTLNLTRLPIPPLSLNELLKLGILDDQINKGKRTVVRY